MTTPRPTDDTSADGSPTPVRVPDLLVEKLALEELAPTEAELVREQLGDSAEERLAALRRSDEELLREHPPAQVAAQVQRRLAALDDSPQRAGGGWMLWAPVAVAAGLALVFFVGRGDTDGPGTDPGSASGPDTIARADSSPVPDPKGPEPTVVDPLDGGKETILLKGDPMLLIDRIEDGRPVHMADRATVAAGDLLQVQYNAKGAAQGVVVSLDGAGVVTLHHPIAEDADPRLSHGGATPLPESYELDDAPGFERFFFVTVDFSKPRLDVATVMDAARTLAASPQAADAALDIPKGWRQQSLLLTK